jgi:hypothetical protein
VPGRMLGWAAVCVFAVCAFAALPGMPAAAGAGQTETRHDTATLTVQSDIPPVGLQLDTRGPFGRILLGGNDVSGTKFKWL